MTEPANPTAPRRPRGRHRSRVPERGGGRPQAARPAPRAGRRRRRHIALAAPQNQPVAGQIVDVGEVRDAALSRVEVTQQILDEFGLKARRSIFDPSPPLAFDDAVRAFAPAYVLFSSLPEARFGLARKDLIEWARSRTAVPVEHIPVRIEDDAIRWDVTHTLVVATQTVNSPDLVEHLIELHREKPHRYTFIRPPPARSPARRSATGWRRRWRPSTGSRPMPPGSRWAARSRSRRFATRSSTTGSTTSSSRPSPAASRSGSRRA